MASDIIARGLAAKTAGDLAAFKTQTEQELAGKADLVNGKVPAEQLPSYVDDVIEYEDYAHFPEEGEAGKIYVALDTGYTYRWSGSEYVQVGGQDLSDYYTKSEADALLAEKQDELVSGENIKTVNGVSLLGGGNLEIETNKPIPAGWVVDSTTAALCESIVQDETAIKGMSYLGKIFCSDLPGGLGQGEAIISIISSGDANGKDIRITLTSADTAPYHWEYEYVRINGVYGSPAGWVGYQPELASGVNIKTISGHSILGSGNLALSKGDVGLGNVDNTSDADKPVSTAQQAALDLKLDAVDLELDAEQSSGAPFLGSIRLGNDTYNVPRRITDLQDDVGILVVDDKSNVAISALTAEEWEALKVDHYIKKEGTVFPAFAESLYKVTFANVDHVARFTLNSPSQAKAVFLVGEREGDDIIYYELAIFVVAVGNGQTNVLMRCASVMADPVL